MRIGELARKTGTSIRMLRYYEDQGLLKPARLPNGYRAYSSEDVLTIKRIQTLGEAGMTLPVIQQFLPCALDGRGAFEPCDELLALLHQQIALVRRRKEKLDESLALLNMLLRNIDIRQQAHSPSATAKISSSTS